MTDKTEKYNPFKGTGKLEVKDTPFKGLKRFATSPKRRALDSVDKRKR